MKNLQFYNPENSTNVGAHFTVYNGEGLEFKGVFTSIILDLCENFLKWIYSAENGSQGGFFTTLWTGYIKTQVKEVRVNFLLN